MNKAKPNVTFSKKVESYDDWRLLDEDHKEVLTKTITQMLLNRVKQEDIATNTGINRHIIVRLAEINGLARKGKYKGKNPSVLNRPVETNIDIEPDPSVLLHPKEDPTDLFSSDPKTTEKSTFVDEPEDLEELDEPILDRFDNMSDVKREVLPFLKELVRRHLGSTLQEVKFITDDGEVTYKVK
jgi:hypothetical protein